MSLTLAIRNLDRLDNGAPAQFVLNRRGAMIGRSPTCDWSLPDPRNYISSRHCEVTYRDGFYLVADVSTNGTFLNGSPERMAEPRRVAEGDCFLIGQYQVVAHLTGEAAAAIEREQEEADQARQAGEWGGWDKHGGDSPLSAADTGWDPAQAAAAPGIGSHAAPLATGGWDAPAANAPVSDWNTPAASTPVSDWGTPPASAPSPAWDAPAVPADSGGWGAPPSAGDGWSEPAADAVSSSSGWAPKLSTPLALEAEHLAAARRAAGSAGAAAAPGGESWSSPVAPPPPPGPSTWDMPSEPQQGASGWSSAVPDRPPPPSTDDVWGALAAGNVVDWASSGFGQPMAENPDPLGLNKPASPPPPPPASPPPVATPVADGWGAPPSAASTWDAAAVPPPPARAAEPTMPPQVAAGSTSVGLLVEAFATAAGIKPGQLKAPPAATIDRAGQLLRRLVGGLVVMVEARARAKSQMGAEATSLSFDGNNPIKFARTAEQALAQLLNPVERGFMDADKAIDDAFFDLQSHQMATLKAMQGALRATLDRFSPTAIRARAEQRDLFSRIMPGAREAALWQAYEREFSGVAQGSDEAFMDTFAKEFRRAYEEQARGRKR